VTGRDGASARSGPVVLYQPRDDGRGLPLALVHVGSGLGSPVVIVDGRLDLAPEARVAELAADALCLGVSVRTGDPLFDALKISRVARATRASLPVIWGGPHPSLLPEECLASGVVDACIPAQGERTFAQVVAALRRGGAQEGIPGLLWMEDGALVRSPPRPFEDVNAFPTADYGLLDLERYFRVRGARRLDYCSSQSSPNELTAEGTEPIWSGLVAERVVAEVHMLAARHRLAEIVFSDGDFFLDPFRVESIAHGLVQSGVRVAWSASGRPARLRELPGDVFRLLRASGCRRIRLDVDAARQPATPDEPAAPRFDGVLETAEKLRQVGIGARFAFVVGARGESRRALLEAYRMAKALRRIDPGFDTPLWLDVPYPRPLAEAGPEGGQPEVPFVDWNRIDERRWPGPWTPAPARRWVPRWNFYLRYGYGPPGRRLARRMLHRIARARIALDFYRLDLERRAVVWSHRARTGLPDPWPVLAED
jgi:anaerobic magnesium-protoporphyrin IX monomethyl ester cyclase